MNRTARVERVTKETQILVELDLDGIGVTDVDTGVPFFDHMLAQLGKHGGLDLTVRAKGDTEIDAHHTVEDTSITLGQALKEALGDKRGISRFGDALVPLDETLVQAAVDLSGRPYVVHHEPAGMAPLIGSYDTTLTRHIFESLAFSATRTTSWRPSSRRWRGRCAPRRRPTRGPAESPVPRACCDGPEGGGARLRVGERALGAAGARTGRRTRRGDRGRRRRPGLRRAGRPRRGGVRGLHGRAAGGRRRQADR
jgi:imidazoleglycerol-phosphate dehydratase